MKIGAFLSTLLVGLFLLFNQQLYAQAFFTVGTGTQVTGAPTPYEGYWHDGRMQIIYTAAELTAAGVNSGTTISGLGFDVAVLSSTAAYNGFTIKMGHTTASSYSSAAWLTPTFTTCYSSAYTVVATGWTYHPFTSNFTWNGSSNVVIEICFDNTAYTNDDDVYFTPTTNPMVCYAYGDNNTGCTMAAQYTSTSRPNIMFKTTNQTVISTCDAVFFDSGGPTGNYADYEDYMVTYTSPTGGCIRATIFNYFIEGGWDYLYIHDGVTSGANPLAVITWDYNNNGSGSLFNDQGTSYVGTSGSLTFHFVSDNIYNYAGWEIHIDCPDNCTPPSCAGTNPANNVCGAATPICDFNGYCGNTSNTYNAIDASGNDVNTYLSYSAGNFCGSVENNSWISFVAEAAIAKVDVWVDNCTGYDPGDGSSVIGGIQLAVFETSCGTTAGDYTMKSNCWSPQSEGHGVITAYDLTPGNTYYIMIDGFAGDNCEYIFAPSEGIAAASAGSDQTLCEGQTVVFSASGGTNYSWSASPADPSLSGQESSQSISVSPSSTTTYTVTVTGLNPSCPGVTHASAVVNAASASFTGLDATYCEGDGSVALIPSPPSGTFSGSGISGSSFDPGSVSTSVSIPVQYTYPYSVLYVYEDNFSTNQGWTLGSSWSIASAAYGCATYPDPQYDASPTADNKILGYVIGGCYENSITATRWATSPIINCSAIFNTSLTFKRWLGVESSTYDHAYIQVWDGAAWVQIYANTTSFQDGDWIFQEFDVSAYADGNSAFRVRFGMGTTDGSVTYSGWNIDDLSVSGVQYNAAGACTSTDIQYTVVYPEPVPVISGSADVCRNATGVVYSVPVNAGSTYQWSVTGGTISGSSTGAQISVNWGTGTNGTVSVTETSANSCAGSAQFSVVIHQLPSAGITPDPASACVNVSLNLDGNASGGTSPYVHNWSGAGASYLNSLVTETPVFTSSSSGTYNLTYTVTDNFGCAASDVITVTVNGTPAAGILPDPANVCTGNDLVLNGSPSGGNGVYTHSWTGSTTPLSSTMVVNPTFNSASSGSFALTYTVTDGNGCTAQDNITVNVSPSPSSSITPDPATVCAGANLLLNGSPSGGGGVFVTHQWTGDVGGLSATNTVNPTFNSSAPNAYNLTYTVTDNNGCTAQDNITVTVNAVDNASFTYPSSTFCQTGADPTPTVTLPGGTFTSSPAGLVINSGSGEIDLGASTVGQTYTVTYTTNGTCPSSSNVSITITTAPNATFTYSGPYCPSDVSALPTVVPPASTGVFTANSANLVFLNTNTGNIDLSNSTPGTYTVTNTISVTGCATAVHSVDVTLFDGPEAQITPDPAAVCANTDLQLNGNAVQGASAIASHTWAGSTGPLSSNSIGNPVFNSSSTGSFNLIYTVTDNNSCTASDNITVTVNGNPSVNILPDPASACEGNTINLSGNPNTGAVAVATHAWTGDVSNLSSTSIANPVFDGVASGSYSLSYTVTDVNGCFATDNISVNIYESPAVSITPDPAATCAGINLNLNGNPVAGSAAIATHAWTGDFGPLSSQSISNPVFNSGVAGAYNLIYTVLDNNGCTAVDSVIVNVYEQPSVSISPDPAGVCVGADLVLNGNPTGGSGVYTSHEWDGDINPLSSIVVQSPVFNSSSSGNYNLQYTVTDNNGCEATDLITVTVNNNPVVNISPDPANVCAGVNLNLNGNPVIGSGLITSHLWTVDSVYLNNPFISTPVFNNTSAGTYSLIYSVIDNKGCTDADTVVVNVYDKPTASISPDPAEICADSDLPLFGNPAGGSGTYVSHEWDGQTSELNAANIQNPVFNGAGGSYFLTYTVTDDNGCAFTDSIDILAFNRPVINEFIDSANCGLSDGSAWVEVSDGAAPYTYLWGGGETVDSLGGLGANLYYITVTDANLCTQTEVIEVSNIGAGTPTLTLLETVNCFGDATGEMTVSIAGGTAPFDYHWINANGDTIGTTDTITGLVAGDYTLYILDGVNCEEIEFFSIDQPDSLEVLMKPTAVSCFGLSDGSAEVTSTGGTGTHSYLWSEAAQTAQTIYGLAAGTYYVTITDQNGCEHIDSVVVSEPQELIAVITDTVSPLCYNGTNGSIIAIGTGGTLPYTYQWDNPASSTTAAVNSLMAGTYNVTVTDANFCTDVETVVLSQPEQLSLTSTIVDASCGGDNGTATINPAGGTSPYSYQWGASTGAQTTQTATGLGGGNYNVSVTDANGCMAITTVSVGDQQGGSASIINIVNITCYGAADGSMEVVMTGGTAPFTYSWSHDALETSSAISNLGPGDYYVTVTDATGCSATDGYTVSQPNPLSIIGIKSDVSCYHMFNGQVITSVSNGTTPYTYVWSGTGVTPGSASQYGLGPGSYSLTVTDANGCNQTTSYTITEPDSLEVTVTTTYILCSGDSTATATATVSGGTEPYAYAWSANTGNQITATATNLFSSTINITVTDNLGCLALGTTYIPPQPPIKVVDSLTVIHNTGCAGSSDGSILLSVEGGAPPYWYDWSNDVSTGDTIVENLLAEIYRVTITDANGCTMDTLFVVGETPEDCLQIPLALTPNGDGKNDTWGIRYIELYEEVSISIFNRWGDQVFYFEGAGADYAVISNQFDGTMNGRELPHGSYVFIIKFLSDDLDDIDNVLSIIR